MKPIGCRAYVLNRLLKRGDKLKSRALIGHLVSYDSKNIYRIWLPTKDDIIRTRDVIFKLDRFYKGPKGYAATEILEEVIKLLAYLAKHEPNDIELDELLTTRQSVTTPMAHETEP